MKQPSMGRRLAKAVRQSGRTPRSTSSYKSTIYLAIPPVEGWKGGLPEQNGWKP